MKRHTRSITKAGRFVFHEQVKTRVFETESCGTRQAFHLFLGCAYFSQRPDMGKCSPQYPITIFLRSASQ